MHKRVTLLLIIGGVLTLCASPLFAPRAYFWNNDRGETRQEFPDICRWNEHSTMVVWQDARAGDYDIWGQAFDKDGAKIGINFCVHRDKRDGDQVFPAIACMKDRPWAVVVWQHFNKENDTWDIFGQLISDKGEPIGETFVVNRVGEYNQRYPAVALSKAGVFTVCWQDDRKYSDNGWDIYARTFTADGNDTPVPISDDELINAQVKFHQVLPAVSMVTPPGLRAPILMCYTWQDSSRGTWDVSLRRWECDGNSVQPYDSRDTLVIDLEYYEESRNMRPSIGSDEAGNMIIAWEDDRSRANFVIFFQIIRDDLSFVYGNRPATDDTVADSTQLRPDVCSRYDGDATIVWHDRRNANWDVFSQRFDIKAQEGNYVGQNWPVNEESADGDQIYAAIDRDEAVEAYHSITWMDNRRPVGQWDIYYRIMSESGEPMSKEIEVSRLFGVEAVYDDDEDYDITATPLWNEDPRLDATVGTEAALAVIDMILENDIDGYWQIFEADTFPERKQGKSSIDTFDVVFADLGWRHGKTAAGQLTPDEQNEMVDYIDNDSGPVVIIGNDFGYSYDSTSLYNRFRINFEGDGNVWTTGNVEWLNGQDGMFTEGITLQYRYQDTCDNYVDNISPAGAAMIFEAQNPQKVFFFGGSAYSFAWKGNPAKTIHTTFSLSGVSSDDHPNTSIEFVRRMMAWLDFRVAPEPVTTMRAYPTATEGEIRLRWRAPKSQSVPPAPADSAHGYNLKFTYYNPALSDSGKMQTDAEFNAANTYYQTWEPALGATTEEETLRGLPPGTPLIFAIKGYDNYMGEIRNATLGDEPMDTVTGDTETPHTIYVGSDSRGGGYVRDFLVNEIMDTRIGLNPGNGANRDTLWFTWDASTCYIGYARHSWENYGDFCVYFDVTTGGADSTANVNGPTNRCKLPDDCQADYLFFVQNAGYARLYYYNGSSWAIATHTGDFSNDNVVNSYEYTEISIPFDDMGYDPSNPFKFLACCQYESSNNNWNAFPAENAIGAKGQDLGYYYYFDSLGSGMSPGDTVSTLNIELSAFTATCRMDGIELMWRTESEEEIYQWAIEKKQGDEFTEIGRVESSGNMQGPAEYRFLDEDVEYGHSYTYKLFYITSMGKKKVCGTMTVAFVPASLKEPHLYPISPNPVRRDAQATFIVPKRALVSLKVYDLTGRVIKTVLKEEKEPGLYTARIPFEKFAQGVYFLEFQCDAERSLRKVTVVR